MASETEMELVGQLLALQHEFAHRRTMHPAFDAVKTAREVTAVLQARGGPPTNEAIVALTRYCCEWVRSLAHLNQALDIMQDLGPLLRAARAAQVAP